MFNGYSRSDLFVSPFYSSLKEEIFSSGFMSIKEWKQHLYKAIQYLQTDKVKNMKDKQDFADYQSIPLWHILCIILYCDTDDLQNAFSKSFRKKTVFEPLSSLKNRHQKYFHFAKHIGEAVGIWGIYGVGEVGPFYFGLSKVLHIGEFALYLKGPTSTSKDLEVAINFAARDGCVMEIDKNIG